jgi:hypothetical protein
MPDFVQVDTVSLVYKCCNKFDIYIGKGLIATSLVGMRIMCCAVYLKILETLIDCGLPDTKGSTYLVTTVCKAVENTADSKDATSLGDRIITPCSSNPSAMTTRDVIMAM